MSKGETISVSSTGGQKAGNLERYDLIPPEPLRQLAEHYGKGAEKYEDHNWAKGYEWGKSFAALNRHLWQFWAGEDVDEETGSNHMVAVAWHAFALLQFMQDHPDFDTRPCPNARVEVDALTDAETGYEWDFGNMLRFRYREDLGYWQCNAICNIRDGVDGWVRASNASLGHSYIKYVRVQ